MSQWKAVCRSKEIGQLGGYRSRTNNPRLILFRSRVQCFGDIATVLVICPLLRSRVLYSVYFGCW